MKTSTRHHAPIRRAAAVAVAATALALTGCAGAAAGATPEPTTAEFPLVADNCGFEVTVDAPPARIVTIKSSTLELLLALGVEDRVIAYAFPDGPVPDELAAAAGGIPQLAEKLPSQEALLALEPDLVFAGWESNLTAGGVGERATLDRLGVGTYVAPSACKGEGYMPDPLTFDGVFADFVETGRIVGADAAAAALVEQQRAELAAIEPDGRGLTALWYSSGKDTPFVGAGIGAPQMLMAAAGLDNVFADIHDTWSSVSWEAIADQDPDVIVLVDADWNTAESKVAFLESHPVTSKLSAVQAGRYLVVDFPATEAGVRNVAAVSALVAQLNGL